MDNPVWRYLWVVALMVGIVVGVVTLQEKPHAMILMYLLVGACLVVGLIGVILDSKPWRWRIFQRKKPIIDFAPTKTTPARLLIADVRKLADEIRSRTLTPETIAQGLARYDEDQLKRARLNDLLKRVVGERGSDELIRQLVAAIESAQNTRDDVRGQDRYHEPHPDILAAELERRISRMIKIAELIVEDTERITGAKHSEADPPKG